MKDLQILMIQFNTLKKIQFLLIKIISSRIMKIQFLVSKIIILSYPMKINIIKLIGFKEEIFMRSSQNIKIIILMKLKKHNYNHNHFLLIIPFQLILLTQTHILKRLFQLKKINFRHSLRRKHFQ